MSLGGKAFSTLPTLPMIFAARIGPTPNIRVRLVQLSSRAAWMLRSRPSSCRSQGAGRLVAGPRPTFFVGYVRGRSARAHAVQHTSGLLGREVLRSSARKEISKQCM